MTTYEAAKKWDRNPHLIARWIKRGRIPATMVRRANGHVGWEIPDDTPFPECRKISRNGIPGEATERRVLLENGKQRYVAKFAGVFSIRHMAQFLQTTPAEVRAIYDDIVGNGGF
jgi:hypothetical protein